MFDGLHLLLRPRRVAISILMRRLLTGYAVMEIGNIPSLLSRKHQRRSGYTSNLVRMEWRWVDFI